MPALWLHHLWGSVDEDGMGEGKGHPRVESPAGDEAVSERQGLEALRRIVLGRRLGQIDDLQARLDAVEGIEPRVQEVEARVRHTQTLAELAGQLEARTRELRERLDGLDGMPARVAHLEGLSERLTQLESLPGRLADLESLPSRLDELAQQTARVEAVERVRERVETVERVRERVEDESLRADDVGAVLPRAVATSTRRSAKLASALRPTIEDTLQTSVRRNPQALVDVIFPVLGPAIRKMIGTAIHSMVGSVNRAVESAFTVRGLKWRMQAWRSGQSYAEVALMHGLVYRVEQVFLIERESGLVLAHVTRDPAGRENAEAVSGMLTAIREFVRDSFRDEENPELQTFRVGALTMVVEPERQAVLAAVVRGVPPPGLHDALSTTVERVHAEYREEMASFDGDPDALAGAESLLEPLLVEQQKTRKKRSAASLLFWVLLALIAATALVSWITTSVRAAGIERDVRALAARLGEEPGIVVTAVHEVGERWRIDGLRDPLAAPAEDLLRQSAVDADEVELRLRPYRSLEPAMLRARLERSLQAPETVRLVWDDGSLRVEGTATSWWTARAQGVLSGQDGVEVDLSGLRTDPLLDRVTGIFSPVHRLVLTAEDGVQDEHWHELVATSWELGLQEVGSRYPLGLDILALAPRIAAEPAVRALADQVAGMLAERGIPARVRFVGPQELASPRTDVPQPEHEEGEVRLRVRVSPASQEAPR